MEVIFRLNIRQGRAEPKRGYSVMADISWHGQRLRKTTMETCFAEHWQGTHGQYVSKKQAFAYLVNERLTKLRLAVLTFLQESKQQGKWINKKELSDWYEQNFGLKKTVQTAEVVSAPEELTMVEAIRKYQRHHLRTDDEVVINKDPYTRFFNQTISWIIELGEAKMPVHAAGADFLSNLSDFLFDNEKEHNTFQAHVKRIKTVLNYCKDVLDERVDKSFMDFSMNYIDPDIVFLLPSEIMLLQNCPFGTSEEEQELEQARDFFLFGCYVGARYGDLSSFTTANLLVENNHTILSYRPKKTPNTKVSIYLVEQANAILEKYKGGKKLLPIFDNPRINELIKIFAKRAGITSKVQRTAFGKKRETHTYEKWERLTMHCARHTFATICFLSGMSEITVQRFLGHSKTTNTKRYIHLAEAFKTEAMKSAWAFGNVDNA